MTVTLESLLRKECALGAGCSYAEGNWQYYGLSCQAMIAQSARAILSLAQAKASEGRETEVQDTYLVGGPDFRAMSGSIDSDRIIQLHMTRRATDADRAWLLEAINAKILADRSPIPSVQEQPVAWQYRLRSNSVWSLCESVPDWVVKSGAYEYRPLYATPSQTAGEREDKAEIEKWRKAEHDLSDAYVRLRALIPGAFDTPHAPEPEQIWAITEASLKALVAQLATAQAFIRQVAECEGSDNRNIKRARELIAALSPTGEKQ